MCNILSVLNTRMEHIYNMSDGTTVFVWYLACEMGERKASEYKLPGTLLAPTYQIKEVRFVLVGHREL